MHRNRIIRKLKIGKRAVMTRSRSAGEPRLREKSIEQILKILKQRAKRPLQTARKAILRENVQSVEAREALQYYAANFLDATAPAFVSLACEAVRGDASNATLMGAAVALYVGAVDIHDDIIDQSKRKNGRSTVFGKFGKDIALLTGDALLLEGFTLFNKAILVEGSNPMDSVADVMKMAFFLMGDAHAMEVSMRGKLEVTPQEYLLMVKKKAAPWEAFTRIGAIFGNGTENQIEALAKYGHNWGILSTIRNDFVDLFDVNELRNRILNEILPLPILCTFENPRNKNTITSALLKGRVTEKDVELILDIVLKSKYVETLRAYMKELMNEAKLQLHVLEESDAKSVLRLFICSMLEDLK
jgi:geranylgeranyl diphosphate synthase type I